MKSKGYWINFCLLNLCVVALLGAVLRTKILFEIPWLDYNRLLKVHSNFAFEGWVSLLFMVLMVYGFLSETQKKKTIYKYLFLGTIITAWTLIGSLALGNEVNYVNYISYVFIFISYVFTWIFIKDIKAAAIGKTTRLLAISAVICLVLSSGGPILLTYLFATRSLNAVLYRNALFSYLHLSYNGFFTLALFALLFHKLESRISEQTNHKVHRFSLILVTSILPAMFLSYHWANPSDFIHLVAYVGSLLSLACFGYLLTFLKDLFKPFHSVNPVLRIMGILSMVAFMAKMFFQSFTIINVIGNPIFGDRPIIMGFLHLVFLGMVTLFILSYLAQLGILDIKQRFTRIALLVFTVGIIANLSLLWLQGLGALLIKSSALFPWFLWVVGLWLFVGSLMIIISRIRSHSMVS